jgi:hypothetical protein
MRPNNLEVRQRNGGNPVASIGQTIDATANRCWQLKTPSVHSSINTGRTMCIMFSQERIAQSLAIVWLNRSQFSQT